MSDHGGVHDHIISYRPILWTVFFINAGMFLVEASAGQLAGSVSLQADSLDFFADAANYLIALFVLAKSVGWRAGTALFKGVAMGAFGFYVLRGAAVMSFGIQLFGGRWPVYFLLGLLLVFLLPVFLGGAILLGVLDAGLDLRHRWAASRSRE